MESPEGLDPVKAKKATIFFTVLGALQIVLLLWSVYILHDDLSDAVAVLPLLINQVGLVYDNLIVGYGRFIGDGQLLKALSQPRFFLHEVALPLMILVTKLIGESNGVVNAGSTISRLLWALAIGLAIFGAYNYFTKSSKNLERNWPIKDGGRRAVVKYSERNPSIVTIIPAIIVVLVTGVMGFFLWRETSDIVLFFTSIIMLLFSANQQYAGYTSNVGEVAFVFGYVYSFSRIF